jgi:hypothetical protein
MPVLSLPGETVTLYYLLLFPLKLRYAAVCWLLAVAAAVCSSVLCCRASRGGRRRLSIGRGTQTQGHHQAGHIHSRASSGGRRTLEGIIRQGMHTQGHHQAGHAHSKASSGEARTVEGIIRRGTHTRGASSGEERTVEGISA